MANKEKRLQVRRIEAKKKVVRKITNIIIILVILLTIIMDILALRMNCIEIQDTYCIILNIMIVVEIMLLRVAYKNIIVRYDKEIEENKDV